MSRYGARIRALEAKLQPGKCRACGDGQRVSIEMLELEEGQPEPVLEPKLCEVCGKPDKRVVWIIYESLDDELPPPRSIPKPMTPEIAAGLLREAGL